MAEGRGRTEWAQAKANAEAIRAALGAQPMPVEALNPYYEKPKEDRKWMFKRVIMGMRGCRVDGR